jgi:hypothetical protein
LERLRGTRGLLCPGGSRFLVWVLRHIVTVTSGNAMITQRQPVRVRALDASALTGER